MDRAKPRLIGRGDLLAALDRAAAGKVTIISAPAGSGKTSLLRAWADRPGQRHRLAVVQVQRDAKVRIDMRRDFFNAMVENGAKVADWREAFTYGQAKATGVDQYLRLIEQVVDKAEERQRMRKARTH